MCYIGYLAILISIVCMTVVTHGGIAHMPIALAHSFYRAKLRVARYCQGKLSVRLSVYHVEVS